MRNQPFYYILVWEDGDRKVIGSELTLISYQELLHDGYRLHSFTGRTATVCVLSKDDTISRALKLDFASMFMRGAYVTITVDLKELSATSTKGKPTPRY